MSLRLSGEAKSLHATNKNRKAKSRLRDATLAATERLEQRQLLNAQVIPPSQVIFNPTGPLAPLPGTTFWINGNGGASAWQYNSSITPNTVNDLVLNVTPFTQSYTGCCEGTNASPGNTGSVNAARLFTNGLTQNQIGGFPSSGQTSATGSGNISDASSGESVLSQNGGGNWFLEYNLGSWPGGTPSATGYDINELDVIAGHQDYRTGISVDISVQFLNGNTTDWFSLSNGHNFSFTNDPSANFGTPPQVTRGASQMAILNNIGGPIAKNVRAVKFFAANQQTWFREFVVTGVPSQAPVPPTSVPAPVTAALDSNIQGAVDVTFNLPPNPASISGYSIQRALVTGGVVGSFSTVGGLVTTSGPVTFVDSTAAGGSVYVYQIVDSTPAGSATSPLSNFITTPAISAEAHFYNQAFWSGPVSAQQGVVSVSIDTSGAWPGTGANQDSAVFTGKVTTNQSGIYTFISNTDDDGYLYVDGVLVSSDPGGHGIRNAGLTIDANANPLGTFHPILLQANTSYDFVLMEHNSGGGAGAHFMWVNPTNAGSAPSVVPSSNLQPVSDPPATPTSLTPITTNSNFVNFTFTTDNTGIVEYLLQREDVTGGNIGQWTSVGQIYPGSNTEQKATFGVPVITNTTPAQLQIQDPDPVAGNTYMYRVAAINYDGVAYSPEVKATSVTTVPDLVSPPTATLALTTTSDVNGLAAGTYFLEYTWTNSAFVINAGNAGQTAGSTEQSIVLAAPADITVTLPSAPAGAVNANVYVASSSGKEKLIGSANGGGSLTIKALPFTAARSVPTTTSAGLAPGTYFVAYTWVANNSTATGETSFGAIDNGTRIITTTESSIVLSSFSDLKIAGFTLPTVGGGVLSNVNVYVGTSSGGENLVGTVGPTGTLTVNTLTTPVNVPIPQVNTVDAVSSASNPIGIPAATGAAPSGVEIHMFNGRFNPDQSVGNAMAVPINGIPTEFVAQTQNMSLGTFFPGVIDRDYNATIPSPIPQPVTQSPDFTAFPDLPRVEWEDFNQVFTGKIQVGISGVYTIISNTDDSGFAWVNGTLVSADPGGHGQQDTTSTRGGDTLTPVVLQPGQSYNLTMEMENVGGGAGAHLKWIEPQLFQGTVASSTNNNGFNFAAITLNAFSFPGVNLTGFTIFITGGTGLGQQAVIESWDPTHHTAIVQVTSNGSNALWGTLPNTTSAYTIAWQEMIPLANSGDNGNPLTGSTLNGLTTRQDVPSQSSWSTVNGLVSFTTSGSAAGPVAITGIDPRSGVTLTWSDQSVSELWFEVQRSTNGTNWTTIGTRPFNIGTSFTDTTAGNAFNSSTISYFYRVRGVNYDGAGLFTSVVSTTNGLLLSPPTISSVVQGSPGTAGLIFAGAPANAVDTGGLDIQYAPVTAGSTGAFVDATPVPLPFNTFDFQVTGLSASQQYVFKARFTTGVNNSNPNLFGAPVAFTPSGAVNEAFGTPGSGIANFPASGTAGDLQLNGNASLTGPGIPSVPTPGTAPTTGTNSDIANPTTPMGSTVTADVPQPTQAGSATTSPNNLALTNSTTFFLEYTWLTSSGTETLPGPTTNLAFNPNNGFYQITYQVPSSAPAGVANANVYIGTSSVASAEVLAGTVSPGTTLKILTFPGSTQHPPTASNTGLLPGTYFVEYTFLNSNNQETSPSPEQTLTLPNPSNDLALQLPNFPSATASSTVTSANVYLGTASGAEKLSGNVNTSGGAITIKGLPATNAATPPTVSKVGLPAGTYFVSYTWQSSEPNLGDNSESLDSAVTPTTLASSNTDLALIVPPVPNGAGTTNVYVGVPVANPTTPLTLSQTTGGSLTSGSTYFLKYEWFGSGVTLPGAEQSIVLTGGNNQINAVPTGNPFGAAGARIFVGTASGAETLAGTIGGGSTFSIQSLPSGARGVDTANTTGQFPIRVASLGASTAAQSIFLRTINTSGTFPPPVAPSTPASTSTTASLGNPSTPATLANGNLDPNSSLTPGATYFVEYTWLATAGGETAPSTEANFVLGSSVDLAVTIPAAPTGAGNANIYIGTSHGGETLWGQATGASTTQVNFPAPSSAATPPTTTSTGIPAGTYYLEYTWTQGSYETTPSAELTITTPDPLDILNVNIGPSPFGAGSARVYLGTSPGHELFAGTTSSGVNTLSIRTLPNINAKYVPTQTSSIARYFTPANALQINNNNNSQTSGVFNLGENINGFQTSFDFLLNGNMGADGFGFVLQDQAQNALPGGGGGFPAGIGHAVGVYFSFYPGAGQNSTGATGVGINGTNPLNNSVGGSASSPLNTWVQMYNLNGLPTGVLANTPGIGTFDTRQGDILNVALSYDGVGHILTETVKDLTMNAKGFPTNFTTTYSIDIVGTLGMPAAYAGFIGSSGGASVEKDVLNWTFNGGPSISNDIINGTAGADQITLTNDGAGHIDWTLNGGPVNQMAINDPNGLTIHGNGANDVITLVYTGGNPLPNSVHLDSGTGNFTVNGLQGTAPLAGTTVDIERSTVFINYGAGPDPLSLIQGYIKNGYNGGNWTGTSPNGVITSANAAAAPAKNTGIGYADSADGQGINTVPNTVELTYTLYGDANLDKQVNSADLQRLLAFFNTPGSWDQGDFNYDGNVNSADQQLILFTFNTALGNQAAPATGSTATNSTSSGSTSGGSSGTLGSGSSTGSTTSSGTGSSSNSSNGGSTGNSGSSSNKGHGHSNKKKHK